MVDFTFRDHSGEINVDLRQVGDLVVGRDNAFIRLLKLYGRQRFPSLPSPRDVLFDDIVPLGFLGNTHIVDCRADDPAAFVFQQYGLATMLEDRRDLTGQRIGDAGWRALREFGARDYSRIKTAARLDYTRVAYRYGQRRVSYRRLVIPLRDERGEVTHLFVAIVPEQTEVAHEPRDEVGQRVFRTVDPDLGTRDPEFSLQHHRTALRAIIGGKSGIVDA